MKITIPKPCQESWSAMTPNEKGAFCKLCCKTVHDLTTKTTGEITRLISQGQKMCVRVRRSQLSAVALPVGQGRRLRAFACALVMVFGSMLFSCKNQSDDHVVGEVIPTDSVMNAHPDTAHAIDTSAVATPTVTVTAPVKGEQDTAHKKKKQAGVTRQEEPQQEEVQQPKGRHYPLPLEPRWTEGSKEELQKFISANVKYPEEAKKHNVTGSVVVTLTVKADGTGTNYKVFKGLGYGCDEEAVRVAKLIRWEPGKQGGTAVDMEYNVVVPFGKQ